MDLRPIKQVFWKIYAIMIGCLIVGIPVIFLTIQKGMTTMEYTKYAGSILFLGITWLGLIGFAWEKAIGKLVFWRILWWIVMTGGIISILKHLLVVGYFLRRHEYLDGIINILGVLFIFPFLWGLYRYAYRSANIWNREI